MTGRRDWPVGVICPVQVGRRRTCPVGLDGPRGWSGNRARPARTIMPVRGNVMAHPHTQDPALLIDALTAVRDAIVLCSPMIRNPDREVVAAMLSTATATGEFTELLLRVVAPPADDEEPGTGEVLERATDLASDARRHLVTGAHLMAGARAITTDVAECR